MRVGTFEARWKADKYSLLFLRLRNHDCCYFQPCCWAIAKKRERDEKDFKPLMDTLRSFHGAGGLSCVIAVIVPGILNKMQYFLFFLFYYSIEYRTCNASCCSLFDFSVCRSARTIHKARTKIHLRVKRSLMLASIRVPIKYLEWDAVIMLPDQHYEGYSNTIWLL